MIGTVSGNWNLKDFYITMMYTVIVILAVELIRWILKLIQEMKKYQISKKEIPVLLTNKDSLGKNTVCKKTISTSLPKITKNNGGKFIKKIEQKSSDILLNDGGQNGALLSSFGKMPSILNRSDTTQTIADMNISQKMKLKMTKKSRKKLVTGKSINTIKNRGENIKNNSKFKMSIPLERTQVEGVSEKKRKL
ncbi:hypothetical protein ACH3XW_25480 [Acanthocheilonema viteae]